MKISEVYPEYVFQRLGAGYTVDCVDYTKKTYIQLAGQTVQAVQTLVVQAKAGAALKFFQIETE